MRVSSRISSNFNQETGRFDTAARQNVWISYTHGLVDTDIFQQKGQHSQPFFFTPEQLAIN